MKKLLISSLVICTILSTVSFADDGGTDNHYKPPTRPPKGDIILDEDGEEIKITIENKKKSACIIIYKIDKCSKKPIADVEFVIRDKKTGKEVFRGKTNKDGILKVCLPLGEYTYEEVSAPSPY